MPTAEQRVQELASIYSGPTVNVAELLCDQHPPERPALKFVDGLITSVFTYGDLTARSCDIAEVLAAAGIGAGDRVATLMGKSPDLIAVILGIWRLGAVYVPLFTAFAAPAVASRLTEAKALVLVADPDQLAKLPTGGEWTLLTTGDSAAPTSLDAAIHRLPQRHRIPAASVAVAGDSALVHMFTSGTTGSPKGVVHSVAYIGGWHSYLEFGLGVEPDSVFWCGADPGWAYGLYTAIVAPLAAGTPTILVRGGFSADTTWRVLRDLRVTDFAAAPTVYRALLNSAPAQPHQLSIRRLSSAGEPLTPEVNEWARTTLGVDVHDHYGQTELGMTIGFAHHPALRTPVRDSAMGTALPGWTMAVLDSEDHLAAHGPAGALAVDVAKSPFMTFHSYYNSSGPVDAHAKFRGEGEFFVTGDIATIDADGCIRFTARDDDVIIMAGYRIGPFDVESALLSHPAVNECAVIGAPDPVRGEVIEAFIVLNPEWPQSFQDTIGPLQQWVKDHYAAHAYPRTIHLVSALPKTPSGKIQRAELRKRRRDELASGSSVS